jgi:hypothetical protein
MSSIDVTRWRFADVAKRLLDGWTSYNPPPGWVCWGEPSPTLPIDRAITALRNSNREPRLCPRDELDAIKISCPYHGVRWQIADAVDAATVAAADDPADMARRWRVHEEELHKAAEPIAIIAESLLRAEQMPITRWPIVEPPEVTRGYEIIFGLHRSGLLSRMGEHARISRQFFQHDRSGKFDIWRLAFCADLGFLWRALTDTPPARTEPFINFVATAYSSLADDLPPVNWEHTVRRASELGLDWIQRRK